MNLANRQILPPADSASILDLWLAQESLHLSQRQTPSSNELATWLHKPGLDMMRGMLQGSFGMAPLAKCLNFALIHTELGQAIFQGQPLAEHLNPLGTVHGGWYAAILDSAMGCAVHSLLPAGKLYTTTQINVNLVKSIPSHVQRVRAIGDVTHMGRQTATSHAQLVGPDGTLYAHATCTCLIFDPLQKAPAP